MHAWSWRWQAIFAATICLMVPLVGCSDTAGRLALSGRVTLDGKPLGEGTITFRPSRSGGGPTAGGQITAGRFSISAGDGLLPGDFRVQITAYRSTGRKKVWEVTGEEFEQAEQYLPARYNARSELSAQIKENGSNKFVFELKSR